MTSGAPRRLLSAALVGLLVTCCDAEPAARRAPARAPMPSDVTPERAADVAARAEPETSGAETEVLAGLWRPPRLAPAPRPREAAGPVIHVVDGDARRLGWFEQVARAEPPQRVRVMRADLTRRKAWVEAALERDVLSRLALERGLGARPELELERLVLMARHGLRRALDARARTLDAAAVRARVEQVRQRLSRPERRRGLRLRVSGADEAESIRRALLALPENRREQAMLQRAREQGLPRESLVDSGALEAGPLREALFQTPRRGLSEPVEVGGARWIVMPIRVEMGSRLSPEVLEPHARVELAWEELESLEAALPVGDVRVSGWSLDAAEDVVLLEADGVRLTRAMLEALFEARPELRELPESSLREGLTRLVSYASWASREGVEADPLFEAAWQGALSRVLLNEAPEPTPVTEAAIRARFEARRADYGRPERRRFYVREFPSREAARRAREALFSLEPGARRRAFRDAAEVLPYVAREGDAELDVPAALREAGFETERGAISEPVELSGGGWALLLVDAVRGGVEPSLEEARPFIERALREERSAGARAALLEEARGRWSVTVPEGLAASLKEMRLPAPMPHEHGH